MGNTPANELEMTAALSHAKYAPPVRSPTRFGRSGEREKSISEWISVREMARSCQIFWLRTMRCMVTFQHQDLAANIICARLDFHLSPPQQHTDAMDQPRKDAYAS